MNYTYTYTCPNCDTEVDGEFTPARPAPFCQNHDSPAFSDPGEDAEWDGPEECPECGEPIDHDKVCEAASEECGDSGYDGPDTIEEKNCEV